MPVAFRCRQLSVYSTVGTSPESVALGTVIRTFRRSQQLTQEDVSFESGVDRAFLSQIERGQQLPSIVTLFKLAPVLGTTPSFILREVEQQLG